MDMDMEMEQKKKGGIGGWIFTILLIAVIAGGMYYYESTKPPKEEDVAMATAEGSLNYYAATAYHYLQQEQGVKANHVLELLPRDDRDWFENNYKKCVQDPLNLSGGLDPVVAGMAERNIALIHLLNCGPCRKDIEIMSKDIGESRAKFHVRQPMASFADEPQFREFDVEVVKDGKVWRVKGFGGGREMFEEL